MDVTLRPTATYLHRTVRLSICLAAITLPLLGCGGGSARPATDLTLVALNSYVGRAEFHLSCKPPGGDLPQARQSCAALATTPALITAPKPFHCIGGFSSWWEIEISGRFNGKPLHRTVSTCWTPQMATIAALRIGRWNVFRGHLVPRRQQAVLPGTTVTYPSGVLRPTDLVTCDILGHHLEVGVPTLTGQPASTGFGGANVISVTLAVTRNASGSVTASCKRGTGDPARAATAVQTPSAHPVALRWLQMIDRAHGYAGLVSGNGESYRLLWTSDGGHLWTDVIPGNGRYQPSSPITIAGSLRLFSTRLRGSSFAVERSDDGGRSWRLSLPFRDPRGAPTPGQPFSIDGRHLYLAVGEGAAAGSSGQALFTSSDGGDSWQLTSETQSPTGTTSPGQLPFGCDKSGFGFATPHRGFAGGYCAGGLPFFYRSDNGGRSWQRQLLPVPQQCACETTAPIFFSPSVGVLSVSGFAGNGSGKPYLSILWTDDGGTHWRGSLPPLDRASQVAIAGARTVWLIGQARGNFHARFNQLYRTTDSGAHWQLTTLPFPADSYFLDPVDAQGAFLLNPGYIKTSYSILETADGGHSWRTIKTFIVG